MKSKFKEWIYSKYGVTFEQRYQVPGTRFEEGLVLLMNDMVEFIEEKLNESS